MFGSRTDVRSLDDELNDPEAIEEVREAFDCTREEAEKLWRLLGDSLKKVKKPEMP